VEVAYAPSVAGSAIATLAVPGTASGSASLQGEGTVPPPAPEPSPSQSGTGSGTPPAAGGNAPPSTGTVPPPPPAARLKLPTSGTRVGTDGVAPIGLTCPAGNSACATTMEVLLGSGAKAKKIAGWKGKVAAGGGRTVKLHLPRNIREALIREGKLAVT